MLHELLAKLAKSDQPVSKVLVKNDDTRVMAVGLKKDGVLKEHTTPVPTQLMVIKGHVLFRTEDKETPLNCYDHFEITPHEKHSVVALEDALFILILDFKANQPL